MLRKLQKILKGYFYVAPCITTLAFELEAIPKCPYNVYPVWVGIAEKFEVHLPVEGFNPKLSS